MLWHTFRWGATVPNLYADSDQPRCHVWPWLQYRSNWRYHQQRLLITECAITLLVIIIIARALNDKEWFNFLLCSCIEHGDINLIIPYRFRCNLLKYLKVLYIKLSYICIWTETMLWLSYLLTTKYISCKCWQYIIHDKWRRNRQQVLVVKM